MTQERIAHAIRLLTLARLATKASDWEKVARALDRAEREGVTIGHMAIAAAEKQRAAAVVDGERRKR